MSEKVASKMSNPVKMTRSFLSFFPLSLTTVSEEQELDDWILDVCWLRNSPPDGSSSSELAVALAHNVIVRWSWRSGAVTEAVHCEEKCILYPLIYL